MWLKLDTFARKLSFELGNFRQKVWLTLDIFRVFGPPSFGKMLGKSWDRVLESAILSFSRAFLIKNSLVWWVKRVCRTICSSYTWEEEVEGVGPKWTA